MAMKKIRLDFSKVEERSGWNTKHIAEGIHKMKIVDVEQTEANDGTDMLVFALVPEDAKLKTRRFPYYCKIQQNQLWKLRDLLVAAGVSVPKKAMNIDPSSVVGKYIAAEVEDETNAQYAGRSVVNGTYGLDILDDQDAPSDDEEDDEEYEGDEEEEEEEEDDEEDLAALTLADLRKRAKASDIDTAGLKKPQLIEAILEAEAEEDEDDDEEELEDDEDLDDEDLDDEELYEDEEEEEEEEPAPAPTRRAAPAKKAPAKPAAKAVPAKRVVKRR
jgi:hypothetical protein